MISAGFVGPDPVDRPLFSSSGSDDLPAKSAALIARLTKTAGNVQVELDRPNLLAPSRHHAYRCQEDGIIGNDFTESIFKS
jgi:hypothetical protein